MESYFNLSEIVEHLKGLADTKKRNLYMPGDGRYQPEKLIPFLGYDQWAAWLIIVEWAWMVVLAKLGVMPKSDAKLLTKERLFRLLKMIPTTLQDKTEKDKTLKLNHDILALLFLMRKYLPQRLHRWLHFGATSYDIISTAYALQLKLVFKLVFWPELMVVDKMWREKIKEYSSIIQAFRTHLQTALPGTVGFWLTQLHSRFIEGVKAAKYHCKKLEGKFSGATGTHAAAIALIGHRRGEKMLMKLLGLKAARISTQIAPPESMASSYFSMVLLSGCLANFGEDVRILQSSQFGELMTESSSSSAMPHKIANPIAAEQDAGMHITVIAEFMKVLLTLVSDLQRDLRWSNVMRSYSAVAVYSYQQILTTKRILSSMKINKTKCRENFDRQAKLLVAELLHLALQKEGAPDTHHLVNKVIAPEAARSGLNLEEQMNQYCGSQISENRQHPSEEFKRLYIAWRKVPKKIKAILRQPEKYIGDAIKLAERESSCGLKNFEGEE